MKKQFSRIYIEITNVCNLSCSFCPKTSRAPQFMSFELFKSAIIEAKPLSKEVTLHLMGEPLLHPQLKEFVDYASQEQVSINLTTNGTAIKKKSDILLSPSIRKINFSLHSLKDNVSQNELEEHLSELIEFTKSAQEKRDDLIIVYRLWNINDASNNEVLEVLEQEFNIAITSPLTKGSITLMKNVFVQCDSSFEWPASNTKNNSEQAYCHGLSTHIGILSNGIVVPCCLDNNGNIPLGNIQENSLLEILNSPRAVNMKKGFQQRKLVEDLCKKCSFINRLEKNSD